ncbi:hypothetical protein SAICODRAFT_31270 [Saitoella complicata NRRL Y-17804]|uniref:uncharacterized protein n=1 Tax=Saitoella complicata (strain BCRC 22490 / CBS 7301 / JCM 7358 / NBRC 10748 / NRRL Y-17804) TaxID=698492 RepID=UPI000867A86C|nr:uncharacterized protein SAICODRAFT_31270 [Saitoella complicata NRRL Y-17804]ODQ51300.1 hypothetical protein SAICODRAFT_31270 [Saitoella complicata NRRL Y-17804]
MSYNRVSSLLASCAARPTGVTGVEDSCPSEPNEDQHGNRSHLDAPTLPSLRDMLHTPDPLLPTGRWEEPRFTPPIGISSHTDFIHHLDQRDHHSRCCHSVPEGWRGVEDKDNRTPRLLRQVSVKLHVLQDSYYFPRQRHVMLPLERLDTRDKADVMDVDSPERDGEVVKGLADRAAFLENEVQEAKLQKVKEITSEAASSNTFRPRQDYKSSPASSSRLSDSGSSCSPAPLSESGLWDSTDKIKRHRKSSSKSSSLASVSFQEFVSPSIPPSGFATPNSKSTPTRRVARVACLPCRYRKVKCDAKLPVCRTCEARSAPDQCEWKKSARGGARVPRRKVQHMQDAERAPHERRLPYERGWTSDDGHTMEGGRVMSRLDGREDERVAGGSPWVLGKRGM